MDNKHQLILAVGLTAIVTDMIPTPADYFVFKAEQKNRERFEKGQITASQLWRRNAAWYYLANPAYWAILTAIVFAAGKDIDKKISVGIGLVSIGAIAGIMTQNVRKDAEVQKRLEYSEKS